MAKGPFEIGDFDENGEMSPKTSYSNGCMCRSENMCPIMAVSINHIPKFVITIFK